MVMCVRVIFCVLNVCTLFLCAARIHHPRPRNQHNRTLFLQVGALIDACGTAFLANMLLSLYMRVCACVLCVVCCVCLPFRSPEVKPWHRVRVSGEGPIRRAAVIVQVSRLFVMYPSASLTRFSIVVLFMVLPLLSSYL